MSKIGVAVCGNSGLDYLVHDKEIRIFRSLLLIEEKEYEDFVEITSDDFYKRIIKNPELDIKTAQTSTGHIYEMYQEMIQNGANELIIVTISKHLSGTYQNAVLAAKMIENVPVHVFDSLSVSYVEALMAMTAKKLADNGATVEQILEQLEFLRDHNHIYVTVDTLKYLVKNGRLSNAQGFLGSLLKLKPLLHVSKEGKVVTQDKIRTTVKAREVMLQNILKEIKGKKVELFLIYTNNMGEMLDYQDQLLEIEGITEVKLIPLTPVVGCHAGPGTMGLGYIEKK
ncbi:MAG: DegV family protein [Candidatus Izemoplasmatales bacterium]|jgi:DegV family protein with EDD domain|nr:DegV family protein [Candidatus Izemoplasmatales bacterium]